jgi:hypothetical protein
MGQVYQIGQRDVVHFLRLKGISKKSIHYELIAVLQENIVSRSSMTRFCREAILGLLGLNSEEASLAIIAQR